MTTSTVQSPSLHPAVSRSVRAARWISQHWLLAVNGLLAVYVGLPWLAPIFMRLGWTGAGGLIYLIYSTQCHQLPERSFFLFGRQPMYTLSDIQTVWPNIANPLVLRQFVGNAEMGWKVAWSDRMVSLFTGLLAAGLLYAVFRRRLKPLPWWGFIILGLPMVLDGGTHFISDLAGIGHGFRDSNAWLAALTGQVWPAAFYAGDAFGSFNSWLRLLTGLLFALGAVWFAYPYLDASLALPAGPEVMK